MTRAMKDGELYLKKVGESLVILIPKIEIQEINLLDKEKINNIMGTINRQQ